MNSNVEYDDRLSDDQIILFLERNRDKMKQSGYDNLASAQQNIIDRFKELLDKLASTPKVNLVEVEKLLQARVDQLYGLDNTGERKGAVDYFRQLCNYTLSDLTSEKEEGR